MTGERRERERKNQQEPGKQANREQGNQPRPQGNQPQPQQGNQPQRDQSQGNHPQRGQPQGSQPQGDQPRGQQPVEDQPKSQRPASFEEQQRRQGSPQGQEQQREQLREGSQRQQGATTRHTTDHDEIRRWVEERNGHPAAVREAGRSEGDPGIVRIDFPGYSGQETLEEIDWDEFFSKFDQNELVFLYQEETAAGEKSNFNKIIHRSSLGERGGA